MIMYNEYRNIYREICHGIKDNNKECIDIVADFMLNLDCISNNDIIIPAPQHQGYAIYTKTVANIIARETHAIVLDIVKSKPRETLYDMKKQKRVADLGFYTILDIPSTFNGKIFVIDNVIDSGITMNTIQNVLRKQIIPLAYCKTK